MTRQAIDTPDPSNPVADTASAFCVISLLRPNPEPSAEDHSGATASCSADRGSLRGMVARDWAGIHRVPPQSPAPGRYGSIRIGTRFRA